MTVIAYVGFGRSRVEYVLFVGWWNDAYDHWADLTRAALALGATAWEWRAAPIAVVLERQE